jgi:hypothetical protein
MESIISWPLIGIASFFAFFFLAIVGAALWEKRSIQHLKVPDVGAELPLSSAAAIDNEIARRLDYRRVTIAHHKSGGMYQLRYDFWLAPDRRSFAMIGGGTIARMPMDSVWFYSETSDGRILCTSNHIGEQDISGVEELVTWSDTDYRELANKHIGRLASVDVEPYDEGDLMLKFFEIRRDKADALIAKGYAYYLDDDGLVWRHSLKGALAFYFITMWVRPVGRGLRSLGIGK